MENVLQRSVAFNYTFRFLYHTPSDAEDVPAAAVDAAAAVLICHNWNLAPRTPCHGVIEQQQLIVLALSLVPSGSTLEAHLGVASSTASVASVEAACGFSDHGVAVWTAAPLDILCFEEARLLLLPAERPKSRVPAEPSDVLTSELVPAVCLDAPQILRPAFDNLSGQVCGYTRVAGGVTAYLQSEKLQMALLLGADVASAASNLNFFVFDCVLKPT